MELRVGQTVGKEGLEISCLLLWSFIQGPALILWRHFPGKFHRSGNSSGARNMTIFPSHKTSEGEFCKRYSSFPRKVCQKSQNFLWMIITYLPWGKHITNKDIKDIGGSLQQWPANLKTRTFWGLLSFSKGKTSDQHGGFSGKSIQTQFLPLVS